MNLKHLIRQSVVTLAACAALGATTVAQSATLNPTGYAYPPSQSFGLANGNTNLGSPSAGAFAGTLDNVPIVFFCVELDQTFSFNPQPPYVYQVSLPNNATFTLLGRLFTESFGQVNDPTTSAAFQLAVWEIMFGSDMNLSNAADFHVTSGPAGTVSLAQTWLDFLVNNPNSADGYDVYFLYNREHQNFVYGGPLPFLVPEPAPLLLFGIALLAMIGITRRRGSKQSV